MARLPHTVMSKFGVAATFIVGAVVGDRVWRHREVVSHTVDNGNKLGLDIRKTKRHVQDEKHKKIISRIYRSLREISATISTAAASNPSVTKFYTEIGKAKCKRYLALHGQLSGGWEVCLDDWLATADDSMAAAELWTPLPSLETFRLPSYSGALVAGVRALWYISQASNSVITSELVRTLREVVEEDNALLTPLALKVVANLAMTRENHSKLHDAGVRSVLTQCANSEESRTFLPAWRALHNLELRGDASSPGARIVYPEGVYPYILPGDSREAEVDIVLVHGIKGGAEWTFRQHDSVQDNPSRPALPQATRQLILCGGDRAVVDQYYSWCWPLDWLGPALNLSVRVLAISYESRWLVGDGQCPRESGGNTIAERSRDLYDALRVAGVGQRPIVWLSHSMGGLLVKQMMTECEGALGKESAAVVFLSVPHHGSPLATAATSGLLPLILRATNEVREMRIDNPELVDLHQSFLQLVREENVDVLTLNETEPTLHKPTGYDVLFVPSQFGDPGVGEFYEVSATHLDICKPLDRNAEVYQRILTFLQEVLKKL